MNDLPNTKKELENIDSILKMNKWRTYLLTEENAVEEAVKNISQPTIIHFATHGYFYDTLSVKHDSTNRNVYGFQKDAFFENPFLRSGLLLSGAENTLNGDYQFSTIDNGILTAYEVANLALDSTELVVLSACNTALGDIRDAEGVYGLQRAFQLAGAKSILMTLWPIEDNAARIIMLSFYNHWINGMNKSKALQEAQKELMAIPPYNHPSYWGAFVLIGKD